MTGIIKCYKNFWHLRLYKILTHIKYIRENWPIAQKHIRMVSLNDQALMFMCFLMTISSWMVYQGHIQDEPNSSFLSRHCFFISLHLVWGLEKFHHWMHWHFTDFITQVLFRFLRFHGWSIVRYNIDLST